MKKYLIEIAKDAIRVELTGKRIIDRESVAKAAPFRDSRFNPLRASEFATLGVEVSLLTSPQKLDYPDSKDLRAKIRVGIDGIVLKLDGRQATFLPQVWEQFPDFDQFFFHLCQKAGLPAKCLELHPEIFTYQIEKIKE